MTTITLTNETCADRISAAMRRQFGELRCAPKRIARIIDADPRAVENYLYGNHLPPAAKLIALMAESEEVAAEVGQMIAELRERRR